MAVKMSNDNKSIAVKQSESDQVDEAKPKEIKLTARENAFLNAYWECQGNLTRVSVFLWPEWSKTTQRKRTEAMMRKENIIQAIALAKQKTLDHVEQILSSNLPAIAEVVTNLAKVRPEGDKTEITATAVQLKAAQDVLDRAGVGVKKDEGSQIGNIVFISHLGKPADWGKTVKNNSKVISVEPVKELNDA